MFAAAGNAQSNQIDTMKLPQVKGGGRSSVFRANGPTRRFTPYDQGNENVDVPGANADPRGRQSRYKGSVQSIYTQQPAQNNPTFAQIESMWNNQAKQSFGGNPGQYLQDIQFAIMAQQGLSISTFGGGRTGQPDLTSEVAGENGLSTFSGFTGPPNFFPKFDGDPSSEPSGWGLTQVRPPMQLKTDLPTPNPGANGDGSSGMFQTTRDGTAAFYTNNPFSSANWKRGESDRIKDSIESATNQPMVIAIMALRKAGPALAGTQVMFDETQEGQIMYQAVENLGQLKQMFADNAEGLSPDKLPHSVFNVVSANYYLATTEDAAPALKGWKAKDVLSRINCHGIIRSDSSARYGRGESFGLSRRIYNCNVGGGIEFMFNEWGAVEAGNVLYHIIKRVPQRFIKASPSEREASYCLTGSHEEFVVIPDGKTRNPFQIVPWIGKTRNARPTKKDLEFIDNDGLIDKGIAIRIGVVFQSDFPAPLPILLQHATTSNFYRAQLPIIGVMFEGRVVDY